MITIQKTLLLLLLLSVSLTTIAQTSISGGIYSNATWTKLNSPYIVTDTVVVFPGVTLTIEPGVEVRFNNDIILECRQAKIVAIGSLNDPIKFTSNALNPTAGIWSGIHVNGGSMIPVFDFCTFDYAKMAIYNHHLAGTQNTTAEVRVSNSIFTNNISGAYCEGNGGGFTVFESCSFYYNERAVSGAMLVLNSCNMAYNIKAVAVYPFAYSSCYINNCVMSFNDYGIAGGRPISTGAVNYSIRNSVINCSNVAAIVHGEYTNITDTIYNCVFRNNTVAIVDSNGGALLVQKCIIENNGVGIRLKNSNKNISCNRICGNTGWDIYCKNSFSSNLNLSNNYWCTSDSALISSKIYDGYDNLNLSLVNFLPVDPIGCYQQGVNNPVDTLQCSANSCIMTVSSTSTGATCSTCTNGQAIAYVSNGYPPFTYTWSSAPLQTTSTATALPPGVYTICVADANGCTACDTVFVDSTNCNGLSVSAQSVNATCALCSDGSIQTSVTGGTAPYSYTWYTSPMQSTSVATGLPQGLYTFCVSDVHGCVVCDSTTVSIGNCSAHFDLFADTIPHNYYAVNMASGVPPLTYSWNWGDGTTSPGPFPSHTYSTAGLYTICLTITDSVGCTNTYCNGFFLHRTENTMINLNVVSPLSTGVLPIADNKSFHVFPNPASGILNVSLPVEMIEPTIRIFNVLGELELQPSLQQKTSIDISALKSGIHIIEVATKEVAFRQNFIKR